MTGERTGLCGQMHIVLRDNYGYLKEERDGPNVVTNTGIAEIVKLACSEAADCWTHIAIGESSTAATVTQTSLEAEITSAGGSRDASTVTSDVENTTDDTIQLVSGWNFTSDMTVRESGVFNNVSGGTMLCRQVFTALPVDNGDSLTITWRITLDQV